MAGFTMPANTLSAVRAAQMANEIRDYLEQRERELEARVSALSKRVMELTALAMQYRDDLLCPPAGDSLRRRLQRIDKLIEEDRET